VHPDDDDPTLSEDERRRRRRRREREDAGDAAEGVADAADGVAQVTSGFGGCGGFGRGGGSRGGGRSGGDGGGCGSGGSGGGRGGGGCDACDCSFPMLHLSTLLLVAAAVVPEIGGGALVGALIRAYRRWLTRYTPPCPSTPSCSAYALAAVQAAGPRRGLVAAARHVRRCGASHRDDADQ
jgi:putative component of membrane protein insertase Oxa1/YidC/SpoIIIJ protein YidD